jgi:hypothetical protein
MPTDGANFGRMKACYGKAYTAARVGADEAEVAPILVAGLERDIRREPDFLALRPVVELVATLSRCTTTEPHELCRRLLNGVQQLERKHAGSGLTRDAAAAATRVGLSSINEHRELTLQRAAEAVLTEIVRSRCLDPMTPYITKHRTHSPSEAHRVVAAIADATGASPELSDLVARVLKSPTCVPARQRRERRPLEYSDEALNNEVIEKLD